MPIKNLEERLIVTSECPAGLGEFEYGIATWGRRKNWKRSFLLERGDCETFRRDPLGQEKIGFLFSLAFMLGKMLGKRDSGSIPAVMWKFPRATETLTQKRGSPSESGTATIAKRVCPPCREGSVSRAGGTLSWCLAGKAEAQKSCGEGLTISGARKVSGNEWFPAVSPNLRDGDLRRPVLRSSPRR